MVIADGVPTTPSNPTGTGSTDKVSQIIYNTDGTNTCQIKNFIKGSSLIIINSSIRKNLITSYYETGETAFSSLNDNDRFVAYIHLENPIEYSSSVCDPLLGCSNGGFNVDSLLDGTVHLLGSNYLGSFEGTAITNRYNNIIIKGSYYGLNQDFKQQIFTGTVSITLLNNLTQCNIEIIGLEYSNKPSSVIERLNSLESNQTNQSQRLSVLESWKQIIVTWKDSVDTKLEQLLGYHGWIENFKNTFTDIYNRLTPLENQTNSSNSTLRNYFKYLTSSQRKTLICGFGIDNHMTHIEDLGLICDITYKTNRGKETASCKCK